MIAWVTLGCRARSGFILGDHAKLPFEVGRDDFRRQGAAARGLPRRVFAGMKKHSPIAERKQKPLDVARGRAGGAKFPVLSGICRVEVIFGVLNS